MFLFMLVCKFGFHDDIAEFNTIFVVDITFHVIFTHE